MDCLTILTNLTRHGRLKFNLDFKNIIFLSYNILIIMTLLTGTVTCRHTWEKPGCHKVGFSRTVRIDGCVEFNLTTNACRGFCDSYTIPTAVRVLRNNPHVHLITSKAECCSMAETHNIKVSVRCIDGIRDIYFKSAKSCACSECFWG